MLLSCEDLIMPLKDKTLRTEYNKKYYLKNREKFLDYGKDYYQENKEKWQTPEFKKRNLEWIKRNPEKRKDQRKRWRYKKKLYFLQKYSDNRCSKCGYKKNLSALEFHHLNPEIKENQDTILMLSYAEIEKLFENNEIKIVCSNCHREIHNPLLELSSFPTFSLERQDISRT